MLTLAFIGCREDYNIFSSDEMNIGFVYEYGEDTTLNSSFIYNEALLTMDVYVDLETIGYCTTDREFTFEQVLVEETDTKKNAVENVHYKPFGTFTVKAGESSISCPITFIKTDDMDNYVYQLKLRIVEDETFKHGYLNSSERLLTITNMISKPAQWDNTINYFTGTYGDEKYRFMLSVATFINDEWWVENFSSLPTDTGYTAFLSSFFSGKLIEYNKELEANGEDVLREEPEEEGALGTIVQFVSYYNTLVPYI